MEKLIDILDRCTDFRDLITNMEAGRCPVAVSGLSGVHRAHFACGIRCRTGRPVLLVCGDEEEADRLRSDAEAFSGEQVGVLPAREFLFHADATASRQWEQIRLKCFRDLLDGSAGLLVATADALVQRTIPPDVFRRASLTLRTGEQYDPSGIAETLTAAGYSRCELVEGPGQFALRGGILDVYPAGEDLPVRIEFWDDTVDTMGWFAPDTQRRTENTDCVSLLPCREILPQLAPDGIPGLKKQLDAMLRAAVKAGAKQAKLAKVLQQDRDALDAGTFDASADRYLPQIYPRCATAADYLPPDTAVVLCESSRVRERIKNLYWQYGEDVTSLLAEGLMGAKQTEVLEDRAALPARLRESACVYLDSFTLSSYPVPPRALISVQAKQLPAFGTSLETAVGDLHHCANTGRGAVVLAGSRQQAESLQELLQENSISAAVQPVLEKLPGPGETVLTAGGLSAGFEYAGTGLSVFVQGRTTPRRQRRRRAPAEKDGRQRLKTYADLKPGDLVVHEQYGIGRYLGVEKMHVEGVDKDYIKIAYAGTDVLYVPTTQLDLVSKYIGSGEDTEHKRLSRLGGNDWEKAKRRTRKAVQELAKELIALYAERARLPGYAFSPDSPWQQEFEEQFEYEETEDQLRCIREIKTDMEKPVPMDRLLCGDVGYGKTEVALRAVMKCVLDGKQAALLCPTTVLARQHFLTAQKRFAHFPVNIDVVSRFRTAAEIREILKKLKNGEIDFLIGTHRLLQKDVQFRDLGLLIVDEEQRFGVSHKERLKEISKQIDVLTLTATPIPRTLNMALSGIRDMSVLEEPPLDRQPVQTYVLEQNWSVLEDAIRRELARGGQCYYLHNRVETIDRTAARLRELLGEDVRIEIAHGKMPQEDLSEAMLRMSEGDIDVLVCTTIIETGIDIPNVNTLIIEDADRLGLAQLHQIRGRVGRSSRRAYAYLTYRRGKVLSETATKRLSAIREYAEFGSGFKIAMRDLEIRGAGNLLGSEQSGFLTSVGYDLYLKLLEDAVLEEQGGKPAEETVCTADLTVAASIPDRYVPNPEQRMDLYRRIAKVRTESDADDITDELIDRYGDPPRSVNNLIAIALLRRRAAAAGITEITQSGDTIRFALGRPDLERISAVCAKRAKDRTLIFYPTDAPYLALRLRKGEDPLRAAERLCADLNAGAETA